MLEVVSLNVAYEDVQVLWSVNLSISEGEIVALIGSNGAGKTTLLRTISGLIRPLDGGVYFEREPIHCTPAEALVRKRIAHIPEGRRLFQGMTVEENLLLGAYTLRSRSDIEKSLERVYGLFPILLERRWQLAGKLSGGEQQMCAIGRGLMANPKLLLIDELSLGLAPIVVEELLGILGRINQEGVSILLVEQDVQAALELAHRAYIMEEGRIMKEGSARELLHSDEIRAAYLGI